MKPKQIKTPSDLAKALDCSPAQVSRYTRRSDWPFRRAAPWKATDVPKIQRWRAANLKAGAPERAVVDTATQQLRQTKLSAEVRKLNAQADTAETELARQCGKLLDAETVRQEWEQIGQRLRNAFETAPQSLVPIALTLGLPMGAASEFQAKAKAIIDGILRVVSNAGRSEAEDVDVDEDVVTIEAPIGSLKPGTPDMRVGRCDKSPTCDG